MSDEKERILLVGEDTSGAIEALEELGFSVVVSDADTDLAKQAVKEHVDLVLVFGDALRKSKQLMGLLQAGSKLV